MKCIICGQETGGQSLTCSGKCWRLALQKDGKKAEGKYIEIGVSE